MMDDGSNSDIVFVLIRCFFYGTIEGRVWWNEVENGS